MRFVTIKSYRAYSVLDKLTDKQCERLMKRIRHPVLYAVDDVTTCPECGNAFKLSDRGMTQTEFISQA